MKVEELRNYGKSIAEIVDTTPTLVMMKIGWIVIISIIKETGMSGFLNLFILIKQTKLIV